MTPDAIRLEVLRGQDGRMRRILVEVRALDEQDVRRLVQLILRRQCACGSAWVDTAEGWCCPYCDTGGLKACMECGSYVETLDDGGRCYRHAGQVEWRINHELERGLAP